MKSFDESRYERSPRFRPRLEGCVAKDLGLCHALTGVWRDTFSSFCDSLEGSLFLLSEDRTAGEALYRDAEGIFEDLRTLGELIVALGGRTLPCAGGRSRRHRDGASLLLFLLKEKRRMIDGYETLMSQTGDRVVRSVISSLISSQRSAMRRLECVLREGADEKR